MSSPKTHTLDELQALCDAARPGPWEVKPNLQIDSESDGYVGCAYTRGQQSHADAAFIAAARTALPELIQLVRELEDKVKAEIQRGRSWYAKRQDTLDAYYKLEAERDAARAEVERLNEARSTWVAAAQRLEDRAKAAERRVAELETARDEFFAEIGFFSYAQIHRHDELISDRIVALEANLLATERELERWKHDTQIEGDYVCPDSLAMTEALKRAEAAERRVAELETELDLLNIRAQDRITALESALRESYDLISSCRYVLGYCTPDDGAEVYLKCTRTLATIYAALAGEESK